MNWKWDRKEKDTKISQCQRAYGNVERMQYGLIGLDSQVSTGKAYFTTASCMSTKNVDQQPRKFTPHYTLKTTSDKRISCRVAIKRVSGKTHSKPDNS